MFKKTVSTAELAQEPFVMLEKGENHEIAEIFKKKRSFTKYAVYHMGRLRNNVNGRKRFGSKHSACADIKKNPVQARL